MRDFSSAINALNDLNKVSSNIPWLIFVDIIHSDTNIDYYVRNNEDITWNSIDYNKSNFNISAIPSKSTGELPEVSLSLFNIAELTKDVEENDGYIGVNVVIYFVHYESLSNVVQDDWPLKFRFNVTGCKISDTLVTFNLGSTNYLNRTFPGRFYRKDVCDFRYKGDYCWMKGRTVDPESDSCNNTLENCIAHWENQNKPFDYIPFGGFPSVGVGTYKYG